MQFNCTIQMDNDAFSHDPLLETARILNELADEMSEAHADGDTSWDGYLRDTNGNKVGHYKVEGED